MNRTLRTVVATFGVMAGVAGIEHGIGEILQGPTSPEGVMVLSWPDSAFFSVVSGEPAMIIVPNLLISGIVSVLLSLIFLIWVVGFVDRKRGGIVILGLSILMLLFGAGFGPPLLGLILGVAAMRINTPLTWWQERAPEGLRRFLAGAWPWAYATGIAAWLLLFPGWPLISYFLQVDVPSITAAIIALAFGSLLLSIVGGFARDAQRGTTTRRAFA